MRFRELGLHWQTSALCLGTCALAGAAAPPTVSVEATAPAVSVWYRSSEGCPDGPAFIQRLRELGRSATLASVGDRVDFVVTLAAHAESSAGRLERQTARGTVALREVESAVCADVAEALALSLELTLDPGETSDGAKPAPASSSAAAASEPAAPREPVLPPSAPVASERKLRWGARASVASGIAPALAPGAGLFAELPAQAWPADLRFTLHGAYQRSTVEAVRLSVALAGGELDACVPAVRAGAFALAPCLGVDVGLVQAGSSGARAHGERGLWTAGVALLRSQLQLWPALAPELQLAALVPFVRYVFGAPEAEDLYRIRTVGFELSVGARWAP